MSAPQAAPQPVYEQEKEISVLALASTLLRWRRLIIGLMVAGMAYGIYQGMSSPRVYKSSAVFVPQGSEPGTSALARAAGQFGISVPSSGGAWGPAMYVELVRARALLEPLAFDTIAVTEQGGRRMSIADIFEVSKELPPQRRADRATGALAGTISAEEVNALGGVRITVKTPWPSVSKELADRLLHRLNEFNLETRQAQAAAERQFAELQSAQARLALREAEERLQSFLRSNRAIDGSPELSFERDRLQRDVTLRQDVYTSLLQSREEARMREMRDLAVITVFERPRIAEIPESRQTVRKGLTWGLFGALIGAVIALIAHALSTGRNTTSKEAREFYALLDEATPRFLRKRRR